MRVFAISDLHIDYKENHRWVQRLSNCDFTDDVVIVAGDITDRADPMSDILCGLKQKFARVFFVPGNHDLWVRPTERCDSLEKFHALMALCNVLDIETSWAQLPGVQIVPLLSWYEKPEGKCRQFVRAPGRRRRSVAHVGGQPSDSLARERATYCTLYAGPKYRACSGRWASHYL